MLLPEEREDEVKAWVLKRLEDISDAETDVLTQFVMALLRIEGTIEEVKKNSAKELEDFLSENTDAFVNDLFNKFFPTSTVTMSNPMPSMPLSTSAMPISHPPLNQALPPAPVRSGTINLNANSTLHMPGLSRAPFDAALQKRKRSHTDRDDIVNPHYTSMERPTKQLRNTGLMMRTPAFGDGGSDSRRQNGFAGVMQSPVPHVQLPPASGTFPPHHSSTTNTYPMPSQSSTSPFPFDPNDPMAAMMAMQAIGGLPNLPGMPVFPLAPPSPSPIGISASGTRKVDSESFPPWHQLKPPCKDYDTKGFCLLGDACPYEHGTDHLVVPGKNDEYDPNNSLMTNAQSTRNGQNALTVSNNKLSNQPYPNSSRGRGRGRGRGSFNHAGVFQRSSISMVGPNEDRSNTTIVVESIPEENFGEDHVRTFFSKFGHITQISMQAYKHLATVTFDDYNSARAAWKSPRPVFDNRFVKVYWQKPDSGVVQGDGATSKTKVDSTTREDPFDQEEFAKQQAIAQEAHEEKQKKRLETEKLRLELETKKEELRKKQDEEQARLTAKIADKAGSANTERSNFGLDHKPDAATNASNSTAANSPDKPRTKALRAQLAALEEEAKTLGIDPSAAVPGDDSGVYPRGGGRGRGRGYFPTYKPYGNYAYDSSFRGASYRGGRGRGIASSVVRLDNRPKTVRVSSGVPWDSKKEEALREFLLPLGPFVSVTPAEEGHDSFTSDTQTSSAVHVTFPDRYVAEKLYYGSPDIPGVGKVEFSWVSNAPISGTNTKDGHHDADGDAKVVPQNGDGGDEEGRGSREGNGDRDYDVADDDDGWGRID